MKIDEYTLHARIYPSVICAIPALILIFAFESDAVSNILHELAAIELVGKVTVGGCSVFFVDAIRSICRQRNFRTQTVQRRTALPNDRLLVASQH